MGLLPNLLLGMGQTHMLQATVDLVTSLPAKRTDFYGITSYLLNTAQHITHCQAPSTTTTTTATATTTATLLLATV